MLIIDAILRFSGVGLLLFTAILLLRDVKGSSSFLFLLLTCVSTASNFLGFAPQQFALPESAQWVLRTLDVPQLVFVWLFALSLFQTDFKLKPFHLIAGLIFCVPVFMERLVLFGSINSLPAWWAILVNSLSLLLVAHMIFITIQGRNDDLLEERRKSRGYLVLVMALGALVATLVGYVLLINGMSQYQSMTQVISVWPAIIWLGYWLFSIDGNKLSFTEDKSLSSAALSSRDLDLQKKLEYEVIENQCSLENNISIDVLAKRLGVSAYRLRAFINQTLGYTNFSSYINSFRISLIKDALLDPKNDHIPILSIALNHGFNSLPPFNRAFKSITGITPTQFRQEMGKLGSL